MAFLLSYLCGSLLVYLSVLVFPALRRKPLPALFALLPVAAGMPLTFLYSFAQFGVIAQVPLGAGLVGMGSALLFLSWSQSFCLLDGRRLTLNLSACFIVAYALKLLLLPLMATTLNLVVLGAAIVVSALPLDNILRQPASDGAGGGRATSGSKQVTPDSERVASNGKQSALSMTRLQLQGDFRQLWPSLCGMALCCMIWGFTWGSVSLGDARVGAPTELPEIALGQCLQDVGRLVAACSLFMIFAQRQSKRQCKQQRGMPTESFIPIAVAFLLIAWMLFGFENVVSAAVASFLTGAGFALIQMVFWEKFCGHIQSCHLAASELFPAQKLFALTRLLLIAVIVFGIGTAPLLGTKGAELFTPIVGVIFFVLLIVVPARKPALRKNLAAEKTSPSEEALFDALAKADASDAAGADGTTGLSVPCGAFQREYDLSPRETVIFSYFVKGHSANFISQQLFVSSHTVKTHIKRIYKKADVHSKDELIALFEEFQHSQLL
jgi:DNA-binding CsgD family transcriptional regulator